jgi:hypothetical protein
MKKIKGIVTKLILHYKANELSPEQLQSDLRKDWNINMSWKALMLRWKRATG